MGIAAGRKVGSAVWRNRIKRLIREAFRLERSEYPDSADIVVVVKRGLDLRHLTLADVRKDLRSVLHRVRRETAQQTAFRPTRSQISLQGVSGLSPEP